MGYVKDLWYYVPQREKQKGIRNKGHFKTKYENNTTWQEHNAMSRNFCVVFTNGASIGMNMQATMSKNSSNNCFT
jgi:hypothetical protein